MLENLNEYVNNVKDEMIVFTEKDFSIPTQSEIDAIFESLTPKIKGLIEEAKSGEKYSTLDFDKGTTKPLKDEDAKELLRKWQENDDLEARNTLIQHNIMLVRKIAHKMNLDKRFIQDNIQTGVIGMVKAFDKFDLDKYAKVKLSSYLGKYVKGYMLNNINKRDNYHASLDVSLKGKEGEEGKSFKDDLIEPAGDASEISIRADDLKKMRLAIANLNDKEKEMIKLYFGLENGDRKTFKEIGQAMGGVSKVAARKAITKILDKLKKEMK